MALRFFAAAALAGLAASCAPPPLFEKVDEGPIPGIEEGMYPEEVVKALGQPARRADGWWSNDAIRFDMDYRVWYYDRVGRVIFHRDTKRVVASEKDPTVGMSF
ncbi:MAG TPA: hypothetical protein VNO22_04075 [Planctomycetota bacterium]|jgi:hypothetical protein|nr:hypothetical protein [Planctomycetota bacterium]